MQYLPSGLVGRYLKASLIVELSGNTTQTEQIIRFDNFFYVAPMGFSGAFENFHVLGGVIFFLFGGLLGLVERNFDKIHYRIFYAAAVPIVVLGATNNVEIVPARLLIIFVLCLFFRPRRHSRPLAATKRPPFQVTSKPFREKPQNN